jgi:hypothetical protein
MISDVQACTVDDLTGVVKGNEQASQGNRVKELTRMALVGWGCPEPC